MRLKQEYFYSASSIRDIFKRYKNRYGSIDKIEKRIKIIVNDIHPTLALIEFIRILTRDFTLDVKKSIDITRSVFEHIAFSITDDSLEAYPVEMVKRVNLDILDTILNIQEALKLDNVDSVLIKNGYVMFKNINMALSNEYIYLSKILKNNRSSKRTLSYTNFGTDRLLYLEKNNTQLMEVFKEFGINSSSCDQINKLNDLKDNNNFIDKVEKAKFINKKKLIELSNEPINPYSIFDVQLSIFHEGKRQILNALEIAYRYYLLKTNANLRAVPTTYIFSGKANEGYFMAKETIKFILALKKMIDKDKIIKEKIKIVFIEDIDIHKSKTILKSLDVYNNLTLATLDNQDFNMLNAAFNMSNIVTSRGGISQNIEGDNSFYTIGESYDDIVKSNVNDLYNANDFYYSNDMVKYTVENLIRESYENFPYDFKQMYDQIMMYNDSFRIFKDLNNLIETRNKRELDYLDKEKWVRNEIDNILWANNFRLDNKIIRNGIDD